MGMQSATMQTSGGNNETCAAKVEGLSNRFSHFSRYESVF